jgi:hypothetical protein
MYDLLWAPIPVAASRELALSARPDAPVIADARWRRASQAIRRRTAQPVRRFAEHREAA